MLTPFLQYQRWAPVPGVVEPDPGHMCKVAAAGARKVAQERIVEAFRRHLKGEGPGPSEEELLTFARLAIAEQRLLRRATAPGALSTTPVELSERALH